MVREFASWTGWITGRSKGSAWGAPAPAPLVDRVVRFWEPLVRDAQLGEVRADLDQERTVRWVAGRSCRRRCGLAVTGKKVSAKRSTIGPGRTWHGGLARQIEFLYVLSNGANFVASGGNTGG